MADASEAGTTRDGTEDYSEATEAQIAVHWREEEYYAPPAKIHEQANASQTRHH